jgi:hypothetical protein
VYGLLILIPVGLIVVVGTTVGLAFGFGVLVSTPSVAVFPDGTITAIASR